MGDIVKEIQSKFPNNDLKAFLNIIYTANWIMGKQQEFFRTYSISPQQYNILRILRGSKKELSVQTIKDRMIQRSPNVTRLMDKLCAKNLIERITCKEDRRVVNVSITEEGLNLLSKIDPEIAHKQLPNISEQEAGQLSDLLDKIR